MKAPSFLDEVKFFVNDWWARGKTWWKGLEKPQEAMWIMVLTSVAAALVGGPVFQYAMCALITNALFWYEFSESPRVMLFLQAHGKKVDIVMSVLSIFMGGMTLGGFLTGLMFGSYFTLFRMWLLPNYLPPHGAVVEVAAAITETPVPVEVNHAG